MIEETPIETNEPIEVPTDPGEVPIENIETPTETPIDTVTTVDSGGVGGIDYTEHFMLIEVLLDDIKILLITLITVFIIFKVVRWSS